MATRWSQDARYLLPAAIGFIALAFIGVLDNGFVNWDDGLYVIHNPLVLEPSAHGWYDRIATPNLGYPVPLPVLISGWLWRTGGSPTAYHAFSLAIHLLNASLAFVLLRRSGAAVRGAAAGVLAFAVHPVVVEPVAWATGSKDLLMATGLLLAMLGFPRLRAIAGGLIAFASKPTSVLAAAPLAAMMWVSPDPQKKRSGGATVALVAIGGALLAAFTLLQETPATRTSARDGFSFERLFGALALQLEHIVAPATLGPRYPLSTVGPLEVAVGVLASVGLALLTIGWLRARDRRLPWLVLGLATYAPVSNLAPLERFTADSYGYVPWLSAVACVVLSWGTIETRLRKRSDRAVKLARVAVALTLLAWTALTVSQIETWADSRALWRDAYLAHPDDAETVFWYGQALGEAGQLEEEIAVYLEHEDALARGRRIPVALPLFYTHSGDLTAAARWYARAFASDEAQGDAMYQSYVVFVARHPEQHDPQLDSALRYALTRYIETIDVGALRPRERNVLAEHAGRLGLPAVRAALRGASHRPS